MRNSKSSVAVACFLPGRAKDLSASLYIQYSARDVRACQVLNNRNDKDYTVSTGKFL